MKRIFALLFASFVSVMMAACSIVIDGEEKTTAQKVDSKGAIGLSVSTLNNPFFVTLVEGAKKAAVELNANITVVDAGDNVSKQVSDIEDLVSKNVSILIVNAVDSDALTGAVKAAKSKGVKVISVDRAINGVEVDCQIASDNVAGAELATQYIVEAWRRCCDCRTAGHHGFFCCY